MAVPRRSGTARQDAQNFYCRARSSALSTFISSGMFLVATPLHVPGCMSAYLDRLLSEDDGADLIEYAFMVGLIAFACYIAMTTLNSSLSGFFTSISTRLSGILP